MYTPVFADMIVVKVPSLPDPLNTNVGTKAGLAVLDAFYTKYPNIKLETFGGVSIEGIGMDSSTLMAIAGDVGPDVLFVNFRQSDTYIKEGFLYPLDEYITEEDIAGLPAAVLPVVNRYGHWWALPYGVCTRVLVYRKDAFIKAGLDPERPPRTWEELYEYSKKLSAGEDRFAFNFSEGPQSAWDWIVFLWSAGGEAVIQGDSGWRAAYKGKEATESMAYFLKLRKMSTFGAVGGRRWNEGKVGFMFTYLNEQALADGDPAVVGYAPLPLGPVGRVTEINCRMYGIFAESTPEVRAAAWKYIQFWCGAEANAIRDRTYQDAGYGEVINNLELRAVFNNALIEGRPEPYGENCQTIYMHMTKALDRCAANPTNIATILDEEVERTNEEMLRIVSPEDMASRKKVALFVAISIVTIFFLVLRKVWIIFSVSTSGVTRAPRWTFYLFILPAVVSIFLWQYVPLLLGSIVALQDYHVVGESKFTGLSNLAGVLWDKTWWASLGRTLYYMFLCLSLGFWPPIFLAVLLSEVKRLRTLYRVIYYLPTILSGIVVIYLWRLMYEPFGVLSNAKLAMICCVLPAVWVGAGPGCLIYLAALKTVPTELYEAAAVDGCGFWKRLWYVTFPGIKGLIVIQFIGAFIGASQSAGFILVMTFGGPGEATKVAGLHIFEKAYVMLRFGTAITMAWLLGTAMLVFTAIQLKRLSRMEFKANVSAC